MACRNEVGFHEEILPIVGINFLKNELEAQRTMTIIVGVHKGASLELDLSWFFGGKHQAAEILRRSIPQYCRTDRHIEKYYIGIASGAEPVQALKNRMDKKKVDWEINRMIALYQSRSRQNTQEVEDTLIRILKNLHDDRLLNERAGRAGRPSRGPLFFLYLAQIKN